jgi:hypothetical protein
VAHPKNNMKRKLYLGMPAILLGLVLASCQMKPAESPGATTSADSSAQVIALRDSIVSFEALFAPGQYEVFLGKYWSDGCHNYLYPIEKALSRKLNCPCSGIFPTIANGSVTLSLDNIYCFPPEVEEMGYRPDYQTTVPLESLRPFLHDAGKRIVFESGDYLGDWLVNYQKLASTVMETPYTLYISLKEEGKAFLRVVLQSNEGPNNQEGTIFGYFEMEDGSKREVTGYRIWGGFVVYDRAKDASTGIQFMWDDEAHGDDTHPVRNRFLSASSQAGNVFIEHVKLVGAFALYEGPENEYRPPENGVPDLND